METLALAVLIFLAVHVSMQNFKVEGASMEPSLDNGEYLIVNRLAYAEIDLSMFDWVPFFDAGDDPVHHLWASPARGDVIVFRSPTNVSRDFIKRIIGVPGDVVEIDEQTKTVRVNGQVIEETYIRGETICRSTCGPWVVPERSYFVMGDNRNNSSDSRQGWFVPEENIIGKALITYWRDGGPDLDLAPNHEVSIISEAAAEE
jgi:signal peptidase I